MSKAEDLAKELFPDWEYTGVPKIDGLEQSEVRIQRVAYIKGYHQAEKDLELTWEDVKEMYFLFKTVKNEWCWHEFSDYGICQEVLKRFKERRNNYESENKENR